tara:strand:- start:167 stop:856 length:690 start_codon:yes stop_codon:yes gene_type:complete
VINKGMSKDNLKENEKKPETTAKPDDNMGLNVSGHILIRDKDTGQELVNKRNAIHYGNMAHIVAQALTNQDDAFIHYMAFGNGATSVDTAGKVVYKTPRVTEGYESGANLYSRTFAKPVSTDAENPVSERATNNIEVISGVSYTDLKITCTLGYSEPSDADAFDSSVSNEGNYVFDELALFSKPTVDSYDTWQIGIDSSTMLSHVIFHPVQKSKNRVIEVIYTIRIQLS